MRPPLRALLLGLLLVGGGALRLQLVAEFHAPAGDGLEYHKLAHELRRDRRFAYAPPPAHLSFGRMPGYPLLLALLVDRAQPNDIEDVLVRGTRLNVLFDLVTALLVFLLVLEAGLGAGVAWLACAATMLCPLLILNCCYLLRETLATMLTTAALYLVVRALRRREGRPLVAAAAIIGLTMLVRFDAFVIGVAFLIPLAALVEWRRRVAVALLSAAVCLAVFSPWPIRNQVRFHDPHPFGANWPDANGDPFPTGAVHWMRTWIDDLHECWTTLRLTNRMPIGEHDLERASWSTPAEKQELVALFARYNREGLSPAVDQSFRDLALRRLRERPLRVLAWLPLRRAAIWWWAFTPYEEQPLRSVTLAQPRLRWVFEDFSHATMVLALLGSLLLAVDRRTRPLAAMIALVLVSRSLLMSYASPNGCQRYLSPIYPLALIGAAAFPVELWRRLRRSKPEAASEPSPAESSPIGQ